tara:strand:+ start:2982 stop:5045 length:2064 start_codon:yes stop_codon:yes gene_type:complete
MNVQQISSSNEKSSLKILVKALLTNIYFICASLFIAGSLWAIYYFYSPKVYRLESIIQIDKSNSSSSPLDSSIFGGQQNIILEEEVKIIMSRSSLDKLIDDLQIDISVNNNQLNLSENKNIEFSFYEKKFDTEEEDIDIYFKKSGKNIELYDSEKNFIKNVNLDESVDYKDSQFAISNFKAEENKYVNVSFKNRKNLYQYLSNMVDVKEYVTARNMYQKLSLVSLTYDSANIDFAKKLLDSLTSIYIQRSIETNIKEASQSLLFITEQTKNVQERLAQSEINLNDFKSENISIDIDLEVESYFNELNFLSSEIKKIELKLAEASQLYSSSNPLVKSLESQRNTLITEQRGLQESVSLLPTEQQKYIALYRDFEVNQGLYEDLLRRQLELALLEASTISDISTIDKAYVTKKVSPRGFSALLSLLFIFGALAYSIALVRTLFFSPVRVPTDIHEMTDAKILGFIPKVETEEDISEGNLDMIESLVTNFLITIESKKVVMVTGPVPLVGKSFSSSMLAKYSASRGKKVLLIDLDYKRGDLHKRFNIERQNFKEILQSDFSKFNVQENLFVVPRAKKSSRSSLTLFDSEAFAEFLERAKNEFDLIIFDTPPILSVSDAILLSKYSDMCFVVVRQDFSVERDILSTLEIMQNIQKGNQIIFNCFSKPRGYYYDYYTYKYYGNYKYYQYETD